MLRSLLSLVTPGNKEKKKLPVAGSPASASASVSRDRDTSFFSEADVSILNDTSVTIPLDDGFGDTSLTTPRVLGDTSFSSVVRKNRAVSFDFCLSEVKSEKDVVVRRRSLQPATPSPSPSDAERSFIENVFDSPNQRNRLHSMIGDKIYETPSSSPTSFTNKASKKL